MNFLTAVSRQMTRFTALIIVLASIVAFIEPATFSWVKGDTQVFVLGIIMLGMGMTLGKEDYQILAKRPLDIFIGAVAQYTIMPLLAIGIAKAFNLYRFERGLLPPESGRFAFGDFYCRRRGVYRCAKLRWCRLGEGFRIGSAYRPDYRLDYADRRTRYGRCMGARL